MSQRETNRQGGAVQQGRETPWRQGLLLTLRDRLEKDSYSVPSDRVAASIIDRALAQDGDPLH